MLIGSGPLTWLLKVPSPACQSANHAYLQGVGRMKKATQQPAAADGTGVLIARALGLFILLLSPVCTVLLRDKDGSVYDKKHYSTLEISGIAALEISPAVQPAVQAALFVGMAARQLTKISGACYMQKKHPNCDWNVISIEQIWEAADIPEEDLDAWHKAVGDKHGLISAACAAVNFGGLTGLVVPVKMVTGGLLLLVVALYFTPSCVMLPNLMLMCFLGVMLLLGDFPARKEEKKAKKQPKPLSKPPLPSSPASASKKKQKKGK